MFRKNHLKTVVSSPNVHENTKNAKRPRRVFRGRAGIGTALVLAAALTLAGCGGNGAASGSAGATGAEAAVQDTIPDAAQLAQTVLDRTTDVSSAEMDSTVRLNMTLGIADEEQSLSGEVKSGIQMILSPLTMYMTSSVAFSADSPETDGAAAPAGGTESAAAPAGEADGAEIPAGGTDGAEIPAGGTEGAGLPLGGAETEGSAPPLVEADGAENALTMETYGEQTEDGRLASYTKSGEDGSWTKTVMAVPESSSDLFNKELLLSIVSGETEASVAPVTESVAGKECYVLDTFMSGELAQRSLETAASTLADIGMPLGDLPEDLLKDVRVNTGIWVDVETGLPVKIEQDLTELGNALFNALFESVLHSAAETSGVSATAAAQEIPEFRFNFGEYSSEILFTSFNSVSEITIPEEARNAEENPLTPAQDTQ